MAVPAHLQVTWPDLQKLPDDGKRHELIEGEHYVWTSPNLKHQGVLGNITFQVGAFLKEQRLGKLLVARLDVVLSPIDVVEPDLLYVSNERSTIFTEDNVQGMPDLLVEIVSDTTRRMDEIVKLQLYERFGVQEYWIVDPVLDAVKVYRWEDLVFTKVAELSAAADDLLTTPLLPGLQIPLPRIFE